jgi:prevent-host-death family protein
MKIMGIREARDAFSETLLLARDERVIITNHGAPVAVLIGLEGCELDEVVTASDPDFWKMIEERRREKGIPWKEAKKQLGLGQRPKRARGR